MDMELALGLAAVIASLLAIAILVIASHRIIEKTYRHSLAAQEGAQPGNEDTADRGHAR